jgi:hypothetical protein
VGHVCNRYLSTQKLEYHELSPHSFRDNEETCTRLVDAFGGTGADVSREPRGTRSKFRSEKQRIPGGRH